MSHMLEKFVEQPACEKYFLLILCKALSPATKSQPRVNSDITQSQNQKQLIFHFSNLS